MPEDMLRSLIENSVVVVVLGYWVLLERQRNKEDTVYYRELINRMMRELKACLSREDDEDE